MILAGTAIRAQSATWLHPNSSIGIFSADTISIFGDMVNEGNMLSRSGSVVNFYGLRWRNGNEATIRDESTDGYSANGGLFRFMSNKPARPQYISGGYSAAMNSGPGFPNLSLENKSGIYLDDLSDLKVSQALSFSAGHLFLNGWNLIIGHHTPGAIRNYSGSNFIVTGGGFVYRNNIAAADKTVVFPVGTRIESYTPAAVINNGDPVNIRVGVADSVRQFLTSGRNLFLTSNNKTWQVDFSRADADVTLKLVHRLSDEGPVYEANRAAAYLARFTGSGWDVATERSTPVTPDFPIGSSDGEAAMVQRTFSHLGATNYFTSLVADTSKRPPGTILDYFQAVRSATWADSILLHWITGREYFCAGFTIERKFAGGATFDSIGYVRSSAPGGISFYPRGYHAADLVHNDGFIFYRLKVSMTDGTFFYGPIRIVKGKNTRGDIVVFPNPIQRGGILHIYYGASQHVKAIALIDVPGRRITWQQFRQPLLNRNYYEMKIPDNLAKGIYFLQFLDETDQTIHTEKIILTD
ncbi:T9SS type A sorting domain-containing protein [Chitinophaga nivalis]|uniref:T9SS type A sorting domain-containing protein n=1 Tax=Chitinophaga nivalis TaxID=2991709 RepID=A0ABT3IEE6_9BACT|nr:T9SS type A sorting domain-containing protein [Chitinophaga nivalis]MCW3467984.1 T9SS type A sorting domain-containing protein [Chitinophaga nivalis]MCW3482325.1 T9SS type A sorting domain-containing protein [Chitinophaga nivalis]